MAECPPFIKQADNDFVVVHMDREADRVKAERLGFQRIGELNNELQMATPSRQKKADLFKALQGQGYAFSSGREWSPAEVFELLRDEGLLTGTFTEIYWTNPGTWHLRENPESQDKVSDDQF